MWWQNNSIYKMKESVVWDADSLPGSPVVAYCTNGGEVRMASARRIVELAWHAFYVS